MNSDKKSKQISPIANVDEFDNIVESALKEIKAHIEHLIKKIGYRNHAIPIRNKKIPKDLVLPQPIASLACSGLLEWIEVSYLGSWSPGDVFLVYADSVSPSSEDKLKQDKVMFGKYYNAIMFGNLKDPIYSEAYIGFIRLGNKTESIDGKNYVLINGAEILNEPSDDKPEDLSSSQTTICQIRTITVSDGVIKIPISDIVWDMIKEEKSISFHWEKEFEGLLMSPDIFDYQFYSESEQKCFTPIINPDTEEVEEMPVNRILINDSDLYLQFDFNNLKEKKQSTHSFNVLQKKEWILDWNCVKFKHDLFIVYPPSDGSVKFRPEAISAPGVIESYNYLKEYLNDRLKPIMCHVEQMKLTIYDGIRLNEAIQKFATVSHQRGITVTSNSQYITVPNQISFNQALSRAQQMSPAEFKKYKSEYIDFLVSLQSKKFKVIPCVERLSHTIGDTTEYAFIFSIECSSGDILIVHENVHPDRSTLIFVVKPNNYNSAIRAIYDFLQSAEINKRSSLRSGNIDKSTVGIDHYSSINHEQLYTWKREITKYKRNYSNGFVYY